MGLSVRSDASIASRLVLLWQVPKPRHPARWWWWSAIALSQTTEVLQSPGHGGALVVHCVQSGGDDQCVQSLWSSQVLSCGCAAREAGEGHSQPCDQACSQDSRSTACPTWCWLAGVLQEATQGLADDAQKRDCPARHCSYGLSGTKDCPNEAAQSRCQASLGATFSSGAGQGKEEAGHRCDRQGSLRCQTETRRAQGDAQGNGHGLQRLGQGDGYCQGGDAQDSTCGSGGCLGGASLRHRCRFGESYLGLVAQGRAGTHADGRGNWLCQCQCHGAGVSSAGSSRSFQNRSVLALPYSF